MAIKVAASLGVSDWSVCSLVAQCNAEPSTGLADRRVTNHGPTLGERLDPPLTTLRQDGYRLGQLAAERLLARLDGEVDGEPWELRLAPELVVRASSGGSR